MGWRGTIVLALLVLVVGAYVWSEDSPPEESRVSNDNLLGEPRMVDPNRPMRRLLDFQPADVVRIRLQRDGSARETERSGATWTAASAAAAMNDFLQNLTQLAVLMEIPAGSVELQDYGLERPQGIVQLYLRGQAAPLVLQLGDRNPSVTGMYIRIGDAGPVVLGGALMAWEFDKAFRALDPAGGTP